MKPLEALLGEADGLPVGDPQRSRELPEEGEAGVHIGPLTHRGHQQAVEEDRDHETTPAATAIAHAPTTTTMR